MSEQLNPFMPAIWSLDAFSAIERMRQLYGGGRKIITAYPLKYLRYWFIRELLTQHGRHLGRPLTVLEVGVDCGQMHAFMGEREQTVNLINRWDAIDVAPRREELERLGYDEIRQLNVDHGNEPMLARHYDVMIFLHVLEHLHQPEACLSSFRRFLAPSGLILGGSPTMPQFIAKAGYERWLARRAKPYKHVSVISPERLDRFAEQSDLEVIFLSGAFLFRKDGSLIENSQLWMRLNLLWGNFFPALGSEIYFALRPSRHE